MQENRHAPSEPASYSVDGFCEANDISRGFFYKLLKDGRGPVTIKLGRRRLISREAARRWREELTAMPGDID